MTFLGTFFILSLLLLPILWLGCKLTDRNGNAHYGWRGAYFTIYVSVFFVALHLSSIDNNTGVIAAIVVVAMFISSWRRSRRS